VVWVDGGDSGDGVRLKPPLVVRNPPSRVRILVRVGGLCNMSDDFNRAVFDRAKFARRIVGQLIYSGFCIFRSII
jgi:hypothetical protein